jgi:hypothetical protein
MLAYLPFLLGSLLFICVGSVLLLAPEKFVAAGRWWGRKIGVPQAHQDWNPGRSFTWRNWRLPGLYVLGFGLFLLFVILRSLKREEFGVPATPGTLSIANHHEPHWYALALDLIPVGLGIFILLRAEKILARVKNSRPEQGNGDGLNPARYLLKAIGAIAILAGLAFLLKHVFFPHSGLIR